MDILSPTRFDNFSGRLYKERRLIPVEDYHPYTYSVTEGTKPVKVSPNLVPAYDGGTAQSFPGKSTATKTSSNSESVGDLNKRFPVNYDTLFFDIISDITEQKTEPISGLICYSRLLVIKTNKVSPTIKIGAYILYDEVLYIIKAVSTSKGYNKKTYQWIKANPHQTSTITMESVQ